MHPYFIQIKRDVQKKRVKVSAHLVSNSKIVKMHEFAFVWLFEMDTFHIF